MTIVILIALVIILSMALAFCMAMFKFIDENNRRNEEEMKTMGTESSLSEAMNAEIEKQAELMTESEIMAALADCEIDIELLTDVLSGIDIFLASHRKTLAARYKAQLAAVLYEQFSSEKKQENKND